MTYRLWSAAINSHSLSCPFRVIYREQLATKGLKKFSCERISLACSSMKDRSFTKEFVCFVCYVMIAFAESIVNTRAYFAPMRRRSRGHSTAVITTLLASPGRKGSLPAHRRPETLIPLPI